MMQKTSARRKRAYAIAAVIAGMLVGFFVMSETLWAKMKIPKNLTMTITGDASPVIFSHHYHVEAQHLKCKNCHTKIFQMKAGKTAVKKGPLTMAAMEDGKFCGTCHNGKEAFSVKAEDTCAKCHMENKK